MPRPTTGAAYLTLILTILGGVIFIVFVAIPAYSTWRNEQLRLEANIERRTEKQTFLENIDARTAELTKLDRDVRTLQVMFPDTIANAEIAALLHGLVVRNGVAVSQVTKLVPRKVDRSAGSGGQAAVGGEGEQASESTPYEFGVTVRGSYAQVRAFLNDLERSLRFFDVPVLALTKQQQEGEGTRTVAAQITLWTYLTPGP